ncbi:MAG TPA: M23 family metallopeptidase [Blastocatellia bacterium]|nr:M23 family metallopeptidase [Blastocatellia bacterium]
MKFKLTIAIFVLAGLALPAAVAGQNGQFSNKITSAPAPKISVAIEPSDGDSVLYSPLAARTAGGEMEALVALALRINNQEDTAIKLTKVKVSFTGAPKVADVFYETNLSIQPNKTARQDFDRTKNIILPFPPPQGIKLELTFNGFSQVTISKPLAAHVNPVAEGSYLFPAKTSDLGSGEFWSGASGHPGSNQRFAYDMGVVGWDSSKSEWTGLYQGKSGGKNEDYRVWNKPVYAMADGTVISCKMNEPDNPAPGQEITGGGGNSFVIQHGPDEKALYAHMRAGTINAKLCQPGQTVKAGELLGRAGNSGSSSAPHLHIHVVRMNDELRPLLFRNINVVERQKVDPNDFTAPWVSVKGKALPNGLSEGPDLPKRPNSIWPAPTKPMKKITCASLNSDIQEINAEIKDLQAQLQEAGPSQKGPLGNQIKAAKAKLAALKAEAEKLGCPPKA